MVSPAIADVPVRTASVPSSEFSATTDIRQAPGHEFVIITVLLSTGQDLPFSRFL